eukprot:4356258-Pyramimonas_sp.AAC.1
MAAKANVEERAALAKVRATEATGDALVAAGQKMQTTPKVLVSKAVQHFLLDLREDLTGSPDRAALEAKYPQVFYSPPRDDVKHV